MTSFTSDFTKDLSKRNPALSHWQKLTNCSRQQSHGNTDDQELESNGKQSMHVPKLKQKILFSTKAEIYVEYRRRLVGFY